MSFFLRHLIEQTVPHDMLEELFASNVQFYDGCLIVQVHDHRTAAGKSSNGTTTFVGGLAIVPFSAHNWNEHITPSSYVPYP